MTVEIILDPAGPNHAEIAEELRAELDNLEGVEYEIETAEAPPRTLAVDHSIVHYLVTHPGDAVMLAKAVLGLATAVVNRYRTAPTEKPAVVVVAKSKSIKIPSSPATQKKFIASLSGQKKPQAASSKKKKKSVPQPRKRK
jgi:hypothetical protein